MLGSFPARAKEALVTLVPPPPQPIIIPVKGLKTPINLKGKCKVLLT